jgi:protein O-mannosyl-transferase
VAWIAERKDVLSTLFWLLTLLFWTRYVQRKSKAESRESRAGDRKSSVERRASRARRSEGSAAVGTASLNALDSRLSTLDYSLALFCFALGLAAKPMLVTLPFVMLLLDGWPLRRFTVRDWRSTGAGLLTEKWPFFLMSAASCAVTLVAQRSVMHSLARYSLGSRVANGAISYVRYVGKLFWPADLALPYPLPGRWAWGLVIAAGVLLAGLCVAAVWLRKRGPYVTVGWFWFIGTLIPVIGLVQVGGQSMADRYTYIPSIGMFILVIWGAAELCSRWRVPKYVEAAAAALLLAVCAGQTRAQLQYWRNSDTLFAHTLAVTAKNAVAHNYLGRSLMAAGRLDEAMAEFCRALEIAPDYDEAHNAAGILLLMKREFAEAAGHFQQILRTRPNHIDARLNLGVALVRQGKVEAAMDQYREVLRLSPAEVEAHRNLGMALARLGRLDEAAAEFKETLRLRPDDAVALQKMAELGLQGTGPRRPAP